MPRLADALAIVDLESPGLPAYERASAAYDVLDWLRAEDAAFEDAARAERRYERWLEDRGYDEARFEEGRDMLSPW
jgi:hypothetical protein